MAGPLVGMRVVDLTQVLAGPYCTMLLADLGAEVIKVEPPKGDVARGWGPTPAGSDPASHYGGYFASVNRNKRSAVLDLRSAADVERLARLAGSADVLVENFRAGVMDAIGLSYETLHARAPRLVYAAIRGFGDPRTGHSPYQHRAAFDVVAQAMGGLMAITGPPGVPTKIGPGVGDIFPATLAAVGILAGVLEARATGSGRFVDVSMYDAIVSLCERAVYQHSYTGAVPTGEGNDHPLLCPFGVYATRDGAVTIAAPTDRHWAALCRVMGRPGLGADASFGTNNLRVANRERVRTLIEEWSRALPAAEVVRLLADTVPCAPINDVAALFDDPHARQRDMLVEVSHPGSVSPVTIAGQPIKFAGGTRRFRRAPLLGEHTDEVLARLGEDPDSAPGRRAGGNRVETAPQ
jgi:crotonobetainyl-CoA:carnitine CoA-transferase CaiB-like acyl-CoA transferase